MARQKTFFDAEHAADLAAKRGEVLHGDRGGETYDRERDYKWLNRQMTAIYHVMRDGQWHTLADIAIRTGEPEASISARVRDFRKEKFGRHVIDRERVPGGRQWMYRLTWNEEIPRP